MAGSKRRDVNTLTKYKDDITKKMPDYADDINKYVDKLYNAFAANIISNNTGVVLEAINELKEPRMSNSSDSNVNNAISNISSEIRVIKAAIKAEEDAAKALKG